MSKTIPFDFESRAIRVQLVAGQPWFHAIDVCNALAFGNARQAVESHVQANDVQKLDAIDAMGRIQSTNHVSESGLFALILGSTKPEAQRFKKWVTCEVLPTIRKTGGYRAASPARLVTEAARAFPPLFRAARLLGCDKNAAAIAANQAVISATQVNLLQQLGQTHLEAENQEARFFTPTELGQMMGGLSGRKVNLLLAEAGLQAKRGDDWEALVAGQAFARIFDTGKRHGSGVPVQQVKWSSAVLPLLKREDVA
ncbi:BRO family protein [Achromobacter mucicolens]|uniref:BRO-N domain-containing protein n=1 Tax=Achromobacter mucicolens TaxID=1389922 RepID=UPI0020A23806|nr:BRO family protein [Achromobacter mucicolens]MCP2517430.1 BRO family protein [Achromobacter mucicolens]